MEVKWQTDAIILSDIDECKKTLSSATIILDELTSIAIKIEEAVSLMQKCQPTDIDYFWPKPFKPKPNSWQYENKRKPAWKRR